MQKQIILQRGLYIYRLQADKEIMLVQIKIKQLISLIILIIIITTDFSYSQIRLTTDKNVEQLLPSDTLKSESLELILSAKEVKKNYWLSAVEVVGLNFGVWSYNKYLTKEGWSEIGISTMKENIRTGFQWDNDGFLMNQFAHPYHGSQYYLCARSNGLSYWESHIYAFGGSLMWELFMENQAPSYNDLINTPVSGVILGEVAYRLSDLIIDESKSGFSRGLSETFALIISPTRGFNRLIKGEMWRNGNKNINPDFKFAASAGTNNIFFDNNRANRKLYALTGLEIEYGNLMDVAEHKKPFDYFFITSKLSFTSRSNLSNTAVRGVLWDKKIQLFDNTKDILGIYKELELLINDIYKFTATQITTSMVTEYAWNGDSSSLRLSSEFSFIALGGLDSKYASIEGKDYNLGHGVAFGFRADYKANEIFSFSLHYKKFWIHILSGAIGEEFAGYLTFSSHARITEKSTIGIDFTLYHRSAYYDKYSATSSYNSEVQTYYSFAIR
jgi:hypothetical protein